MANDTLKFQPFGSGYEVASDGKHVYIRFGAAKDGARPSSTGKMMLTAVTSKFLEVPGNAAGLRINATVGYYANPKG